MRSVLNALSETKIRNLHPKLDDEQPGRSLSYGSPLISLRGTCGTTSVPLTALKNVRMQT